MSAITDMQDRSTCILFGDGAGGVMLEPSIDPNVGLVDFEVHADGSEGKSLQMPGGGSLDPASHGSVDQRMHFIQQDGKAVFKSAVQKMVEVSLSLLKSNGMSTDDLTLFVSHQANMRIVSATTERMGLPLEKVMANIEKYANTTAATIPIALSEAVEQNCLQRGDLVQFTAVGGGLTWGNALVRWGA